MQAPESPQCKYKSWFWLNQSTGEVSPYCCGSWACSDHRAAVAYKWACRVAQARPERMVTFTNIPRDKERAYLAYSHLVQAIRREGLAFEYCRFMEVGSKTGMYHFHLAQKGSYIPQRLLSHLAESNGLGRIVDIRRCQQKGPEWYLAKYITKEGCPAGWRKVAQSRKFFGQPEPKVKNLDWTLVRPLNIS